MKLSEKVTRRDAMKIGAIGAAGFLFAGMPNMALSRPAYADEREKIYYTLDETNCPEIKHANDFAHMKYEEAVARSLAEGEDPVVIVEAPLTTARGADAICTGTYQYPMPGHSTSLALIGFTTSYYRAVDERGVARFGDIYSCYAYAADLRTGVTEEGSSAPVRLDGGRTLAKGFGLYIEAEDWANPYVVWTAHQAFYVEFGAESNTARIYLP